MEKNPKISEAIQHLGGATALSKMLGIKNYQTVQQWRGARQVPSKYCMRIEIESAGKYSRADLRPDDYWLIWPELAALVEAEEIAHA